MAALKDTLFSLSAGSEGVSSLFQTATTEDDNLFVLTDIPSLTKQFTSLPIEILPQRQDVPESTLFGTLPEEVQVPPSPTSSILSSPDEVTQHTIPDDDLWQQAKAQPCTLRDLHTWEAFGASRTNVQSHVNPFVTEQTPKVFDELLKRHMNHIYSPNESGVVVDEYLFREVISDNIVLTVVSSCGFCRS